MQTIVWRRRGNRGKSEVIWSNQRFNHPSMDSFCPDLQRIGPSMMCNMLGERSRKSLQLVILRDLPHTYSCTCFYSKGKQRWKQQGLYQFWTPGNLNFIQIKSEKCLKHQFFLFFLRIRAISRQCFVYDRKLDHVGSSCSYHGDVVPSFTTIYRYNIVQAARLVHKYNYEPCKDIMINKTKSNHRKGR